MKRDPLLPTACTVVMPQEYNIEAQMKRAVRLANLQRQAYIPFDVGKLVGLYLAYKELKAKEGTP
jgi:hypothetical protein